MVIPSQVTLPTCYIGGTWDGQLDFWDDTAHTVPHSFVGTTVEFVIHLPDGNTLNGNASVSGGSVILSLTSVQTTTLTQGLHSWYLKTSTAATPPVVLFYAKGTLDCEEL